MANKKNEEQMTPVSKATKLNANANAPSQNTTGYVPSDRVNQMYDQLGAYNTYRPSNNVSAMRDSYMAHEGTKPSAWTGGQYGTMLQDSMNKINNREKFTYDLNGDALYQQYKDRYMNQGNLAMQDVMGQASALTGGYGSSYVQTAGNQAYRQSLTQLNDVIPELYQLAYARYQGEGQDLMNQYNMYRDAYNTEYGQYRDTVGDWNTEANRLYGMYSDERNFDYGQFGDDRNYHYGMYNDERNFDMNKYAQDLAQRQWQEEMDFKREQADIANSQWEREFALKNGSGSGSSGSGVSRKKSSSKKSSSSSSSSSASGSTSSSSGSKYGGLSVRDMTEAKRMYKVDQKKASKRK